MKKQERRRFFRINESVGLSFNVLDERGLHTAESGDSGIVNEHDERIETLLQSLAEHQPDLSELLRLMHQKLERALQLVHLDSHIIEHISQRVQEVNISACGLGFYHDEALNEGDKLALELTLFPEKHVLLIEARVVSCELISCASDEVSYYCRINFESVSEHTQELLIQHIVRTQSTQLKSRATSSPEH